MILMQRRPHSDISLRLVSPWSDNALARSHIVVSGKTVGQSVVGVILEAVIEWEGHHLLFITDDIPFEDSLRMYLFDAEWMLVDSARMGAIYSTGVFSGLTLLQPDVLRFKFFGGIVWTLRLLRKSVLSLPFSDPPGVSRPFGLRKRFIIHGKPLRESDV